MARPGPLPVDPADPLALRRAFGRFPTGVTIVTAAGPSGPAAIAANSFASVSLDPPLVLWSVARRSRRFGLFDAAGHYAIHVLAADQAPLCRAVSGDMDALRAVRVSTSPEGVPLLADCLARFECRAVDRIPAGDHVVVLGEVLRADAREGDALTFFGGRLGRIEPG